MHTFKIILLATGNFDSVTVQHVVNVVRQQLEEDDTYDVFEKNFKIELVKQLDDSFMCAVNDMNTSYFINVFSRGRKNILIRAQRQKMVTLKDIAAYAVGRDVSEEDDVEILGIPVSLYKDVRHFMGCTRK